KRLSPPGRRKLWRLRPRKTHGFLLIKSSERPGNRSVKRWPARPRPARARWSNAIFLQPITVVWSKPSLRVSDRFDDRRQFKPEIYQGNLSTGSRGGRGREGRPDDRSSTHEEQQPE